MGRVQLETERLVICELSPFSAGVVSRFTAANWEFHRRWEPFRDAAYFSRRQVARRLRYLARSQRDYGFWLFQRDARRGPAIGSITLTSIVRGSMQSCFLGYKMDEQFLRRGYMREALRAVIDFAFDELHLHRIEANVMPANEASLGLLRSLSFREEGLARRYLRIQGAWEDHLHMVLLAEDYAPAIKI
jgi:ribosomal-protein-alanine N-acetyltransferase